MCYTEKAPNLSRRFGRPYGVLGTKNDIVSSTTNVDLQRLGIWLGRRYYD